MGNAASLLDFVTLTDGRESLSRDAGALSREPCNGVVFAALRS
jgi:hypothetical protein